MSDKSPYRPSLTFDEVWVIHLALESASFVEEDNKQAAESVAKKMSKLLSPRPQRQTKKDPTS
jgi:hypothetical protein